MISLLQGPNFCVSHQDFLRLVLPSLCDGDAVLLLYTHSGGKFGRRSHDGKVTLRNIPRALTSVHFPPPLTHTPHPCRRPRGSGCDGEQREREDVQPPRHLPPSGRRRHCSCSLTSNVFVCLYICMSVYLVGLTLLCVFFFNRIQSINCV